MANFSRTEWFKKAIKHERWKEPGWIQTVFTVTELKSVNDVQVSLSNTPQPFDLFVAGDDKHYCYWDNEESEFVIIDGAEVTEPILRYKDKIKLNVGDLPNIKEPTDTNVGTVVINLYMCVYAFGDKLPFFNGQTDGGNIQKFIIARALSGDPDAPTPAEILQWKKATAVLAIFAAICCPSGTRASFTVNKQVIDLRDQLLKKHETELDNVAVIADIEKQLVDYDTKLRAGDESDGFFMNQRKLAAVGRKKQMIMYGVEGGLDGKTNLIRRSLNEGMDYKELPLYADAITAASQSRGLLTAQGGELVNYNLRMFQNSRIQQEDCETKLYLPMVVSDDNKHMLPGRYMATDKTPLLMTEKMIASLMGKTIKLRSAGYCNSAHLGYCKTCCDTHIARTPDGIAVATGRGTNIIMNDSMKAMHGRVDESFDFVLADHIS